jgi:mannose-6-phosphate isomerase-like protein (cupin superfamily)
MKVLAGGCRVYAPGEGQLTARGPWTARTVMCRMTGTALITQTISEYAMGSSPTVTNPTAEEVLYIVSGTGTCHLDGFAYPLRPGLGVFVPPGVPYRVENAGPQDLHVVSACCPEDSGRQVADAPVTVRSGEPPRRTVHGDDREPIRAGRDRLFRYLVHTDVGCKEVTQFVGWIPTSKAPFHRHTYEEGIYILEGHGMLHLHDQPTPTEFGPGTSIYLPVGVVHCLENPGPTPIRVLGVFHPSGSPGVAYEDD